MKLRELAEALDSIEKSSAEDDKARKEADREQAKALKDARMRRDQLRGKRSREASNN